MSRITFEPIICDIGPTGTKPNAETINRIQQNLADKIREINKAITDLENRDTPTTPPPETTIVSAGGVGPTGPTGTQGPPGPPGPIGPQGPPGTSIMGGGDGDNVEFGNEFPADPERGDVFVFTEDTVLQAGAVGTSVTLTFGSSNALSGRLRVQGTTENLATGTSGNYTVAPRLTAGSVTYTYEGFSGQNFTGTKHTSTVTVVWS